MNFITTIDLLLNMEMMICHKVLSFAVKPLWLTLTAAVTTFINITLSAVAVARLSVDLAVRRKIIFQVHLGIR